MSKFRDVEDVVSAAVRLQMTQVSWVARCLGLSLMPAFSNLSIPLPLHLLSSILPFFTLRHISPDFIHYSHLPSTQHRHIFDIHLKHTHTDKYFSLPCFDVYGAADLGCTVQRESKEWCYWCGMWWSEDRRPVGLDEDVDEVVEERHVYQRRRA